MKISALKQMVIDLNDQEPIEYDTSFTTAVNLATAHVMRMIPDRRRLELFQKTPIFELSRINSQYEFDISGATSLSFCASGRGRIKYDGNIVRGWDSARIEQIKLAVNDLSGVTITIEIDAGYVSQLAVWDIYVSDIRQVPIYGGYCEYDLDAYADDISGNISRPASGTTGLPIDSIISGHTVSLKNSFTGSFSLEYDHLPTAVTLQSVDDDIDVDIAPNLTDVLALGTAYYLWLEDEPAKAAFYLQRFSEQLSIARAYSAPTGVNTVISAYGW